MSKVDHYRQKLRQMEFWEPFLLQESGLPGPRGNLELVQAVADEGNEALFRRWLSLGPDVAPTGTAHEYLPVCGAVGLGRLLAEGRADLLGPLRACASDPRWRVREGVAMALQRLGDSEMERLLQVAEEWSRGNPLEQRAAAAGLCEPRLLTNFDQAARVLHLLDRMTASLDQAGNRSGQGWRVLRQGLGYCWSVAIAACPEVGKSLFERWLASAEPDVRWIVRENLKKKRLARMGRDWVERLKEQLDSG